MLEFLHHFDFRHDTLLVILGVRVDKLGREILPRRLLNTRLDFTEFTAEKLMKKKEIIQIVLRIPL